MGDRALESLATTAKREPERVDVRRLCAFLGSDDAGERNRAEDVRALVLETVRDPSPTVDSLRDLLDDPNDGVRRAAVETLSRFVRAWPRDFTPEVAAELESSDVRRRAAAADVLGRTPDGAVVPHAPSLIGTLEDPDERVAGLALGAVAGLAGPFPEAVVPAVPRVRRFLDDEWIPGDGGRARLVYSRTDRETESGEPDRVRLTNRVPRPFESARSLLETIALTHPKSLESVLPGLRALVDSPPEGLDTELPSLLRTLARVARTDPSTVEPILPAVERRADSDSRQVRIAARNLLEEIGHEVDRPDPVSVPSSMATRNRPERARDEDLLADIDQRTMLGEVDVDDAVDLLHCEDADVRDVAAWGLECGNLEYLDEIHDRATTFLSLLNEPDDCTREHLLLAIGPVVRTYPGEWIPALLELADHDDPNVRSTAIRLLASAAGVYPSLVWADVETIAARLSDEPDVRASVFLALRPLAEAAPDATAPHVLAAVDALDAPETRIEALRFLESLARVRPAVVAEHVDSLERLIERLAGSNRIENRARVGRSGSVQLSDDDRTLREVFRVCLRLASNDPDAVASIRPRAKRVVEGRFYGQNPALAALAAIDDTD